VNNEQQIIIYSFDFELLKKTPNVVYCL